jgi:hypothetical protein
METRLVGAALMHADRRTGRHKKVNVNAPEGTEM